MIYLICQRFFKATLATRRAASFASINSQYARRCRAHMDQALSFLFNGRLTSWSRRSTFLVYRSSSLQLLGLAAMSAQQFFQRCGKHIAQAVGKHAASSSYKALDAALPALRQAVAASGRLAGQRALGAGFGLPVSANGIKADFNHSFCCAGFKPWHVLVCRDVVLQAGLARQPLNMSFAASATMPKCAPPAAVSAGGGGAMPWHPHS